MRIPKMLISYVRLDHTLYSINYSTNNHPLAGNKSDAHTKSAKLITHLWWNNKVGYVKGRLLNVASTVLSVVAIATVVVPRPLELCRDCTLYRSSLLVALLPSNAVSMWV